MPDDPSPKTNGTSAAAPDPMRMITQNQSVKEDMKDQDQHALDYYIYFSSTIGIRWTASFHTQIPPIG